MSLSRTLVASLALSIAAIGCGGMTPPADSGVTTDTGVSTDSGVMTSDGGTTTDGGGGSGTCGDTTRACMCACGMNASCQQGCINMNMACGNCVVSAQVGCCPTEAQAFAACAQDARMNASDAGPACGTDNNCIAMRCQSQFQAIGTCFQTAMTQPTCRDMLAGCFGEYPFRCN